MDVVFTRENLVHAISGACGGASAITVFYPLNIARTRIQVSDDVKSEGTLATLTKIVKEEGPEGIFRGWWTTVVALACSNFVYFYSYNLGKVALQSVSKSNKPIGVWSNLGVASASGVINCVLTTPFWVVTTRVSTNRREGKKPFAGMIDGLRTIVDEEGIGSLWNGLLPSLLLVSNPVIQFVVYERIKIVLEKLAARRKSPITSFEFFLTGAIAKAAATVATYPIQLAQSKLRAKDGSSKEKYTGTVDCLSRLAKLHGVLSWFKGMEAKLWQTVLTAAFQFLMYEKIAGFIFFLLLRKKLKANA